jgi:hypothetical protein
VAKKIWLHLQLQENNNDSQQNQAANLKEIDMSTIFHFPQRTGTGRNGFFFLVLECIRPDLNPTLPCINHEF